MIIAILIFAFNIFLLIFPNIILPAARTGLLLWFNNVLPSLFPFIVASNMLMALGGVKLLGNVIAPIMEFLFKLPKEGGFALIVGFTSGYPLGAKVVADLHKDRQLSNNDAQHMLGFCNNAGPLFIVGVVGIGMFQSSQIGYVLWVGHVIAALLLGIMLRFLKKPDKNDNGQEVIATNSPQKINSINTNLEQLPQKSEVSNKTNIGMVLGESVKNAMESMTLIGGLIIFFSVVIAIVEAFLEHLQEFSPNGVMMNGLIAGTIEVTGGLSRLACSNPSSSNLAIAAFIIAFGGFSIHAQTLHFTSKTGIRVMPYLFAKIVHGVIAAIITIGIDLLHN